MADADPYLLVVAGPAARAIADVLPQAFAVAVIALLTGDLVAAPHRVGKPLRRELEGLWVARRGTFRVGTGSTMTTVKLSSCESITSAMSTDPAEEAGAAIGTDGALWSHPVPDRTRDGHGVGSRRARRPSMGRPERAGRARSADAEEGKTKKEAIRCVKRRLSDAVYLQLYLDAGRAGM